MFCFSVKAKKDYSWVFSEFWTNSNWNRIIVLCQINVGYPGREREKIENLSHINWTDYFCYLLLVYLFVCLFVHFFIDTLPELIHTFIAQNVRPGPHISLKCVASGSPPPQVSLFILDTFLTHVYVREEKT